ncbi:MAG: DUF58 domain-containing protein [Acidimicrobiia bacterium]
MPKCNHANPLFAGENPRQIISYIDLTIRKKLDGLAHGIYKNIMPGSGMEPSEARKYFPGDDVRRIDWTITARTQELYVRDQEAEKEMTSWIVLNLAPSTHYGTGRIKKCELGLYSALLSAMIILKSQGNRVGFILGDKDGSVIFKPESNSNLVYRMLEQYQSFDARDRTKDDSQSDLSTLLKKIGALAVRRSTIIVISPMSISKPSQLKEELSLLQYLNTKHHVVLIQNSDKRDLELVNAGIVDFINPDTGKVTSVDTSSIKIRNKYKEICEIKNSKLIDSLNSSNITHIETDTHDDFEKDFVRAFAFYKQLNQMGK